MVQCCVQRDRSDKRSPTYHMFEEVEDGRKGSVLQKMKNNQGAGLIKLETKLPAWDEEKRAYVLDFNGRVKKGSVKNFQIVCSDGLDELVIQFGRADEDRFVLDYSSPLCALHAFAIALSCFDE
ncbi:hypothetical protein AOLI_G00245410 [Acnodon oligacanthus]